MSSEKKDLRDDDEFEMDTEMDAREEASNESSSAGSNATNPEDFLPSTPRPRISAPEVLLIKILISDDDVRKRVIPYKSDLLLLSELDKACKLQKLELKSLIIEDEYGKQMSLTEADKASVLPTKVVILRSPEYTSKVQLNDSDYNMFLKQPKFSMVENEVKRTMTPGYYRRKTTSGSLVGEESFSESEEISSNPDDPKSIPLSFEALVDKIIQEHDDTEYVNFYFLVYTTFCTPVKFLETLVEKYKETTDGALRLKIIATINLWMTHRYTDFVSTKQVAEVFESWCTWVLENDPTNQQALVPLRNKRIQPSTSTVTTPKTISPDYEPVIPTASPLTLMDIDSMEFARQLTIVESKLFNEVLPQELVNQAWTKNKAYAPNVDKLTKHFNGVSNFVQTEILTEPTAKKRIRIVEKLIDISENLRQMNNFNGVFEIGSALESSSVARLKSTFGGISLARHQTWGLSRDLVLQKKLPQALKEAKFGVPYLGMYLTHLTQIDEGNQNKTKEGLINMKKRCLIYKSISQVQFFQKTIYNFVPVPAIQEYLQVLEGISEDLLFKFSLFLEPRPNSPAPDMPEELKEIINKKNLLRKKRTRTVQHHHHPSARNIKTVKKERASTDIFLAQHKESIQKAHDRAKNHLTSLFNELREDKTNIDKIQESTFQEMKLFLNVVNNEITTLAEEIEPSSARKNSEDTSGIVVWDDPRKIPAGAYLPTLVEWVWHNEKGGFSAFDTQTALMIEIAYSKDKFGECKLTHGFFGNTPGGYVIDFKKMLQINAQTGFGRVVQRRMNWITATEHKRKCFEYDNKIKLLEEEKQKIQQQIQELQQKVDANDISKKKKKKL